MAADFFGQHHRVHPHIDLALYENRNLGVGIQGFKELKLAMKNILLVDDDHISNFLNTKTLERMDFVSNIQIALNGKQAIEFLKEYYIGAKPLPDIILLDLNMPVMDGFGFLEAFRGLNLPGKDHVKIIVVSSSPNLSDIAKAKRYGAHQYLSKPANEQTLRQVLEMFE